MNILIVKTSSLGDIIHTLPALTDAANHYTNIHFDWLAEDSFAEIPTWHPNVDKVIPTAWRRWRKNLWDAWQEKKLHRFYHDLREKKYDLIIDAQGLLKSAFMGRLAKGMHCGLDYYSARESLASFLYKKRFTVLFQQHAVTRARQLFAQALGYTCPQHHPDYAIRTHFASAQHQKSKNILFIHGTTWQTKEWPEKNWIELASQCIKSDWNIQIPWGNEAEKARAERIAKTDPNIRVLPKSSLKELANLLLQARAAIAVDTGIGHLAAALSVPTISLYGPTDPDKIGAWGEHQVHLKNTQDISSISANQVWEHLEHVIRQSETA